MSASVQLIQITSETLVEVSGIKEISGMYFENNDVAISVECANDVSDKTIKLSIKLTTNNFVSFSFDIPILAQRIALSQLISGSKVIIVPNSIDEDLCDIQAIKKSLHRNGGIWIDGLPDECIRKIVKFCLY